MSCVSHKTYMETEFINKNENGLNNIPFTSLTVTVASNDVKDGNAWFGT